jgi:hypothetical protein
MSEEVSETKPHHWDKLKEAGECAYCDFVGEVGREPFGGQLACAPCWSLIVYGDPDDG